MLKIINTFIAVGLMLGTNLSAHAQGNAHTPEQIAEKLRQLEAMTAEKIKNDFKEKFKEDMEALDLERMAEQKRERIERYLENVERAQEESFAEIRSSIENQSGQAKEKMKQQLEQAESFWERNYARVKEMFEDSK